MQAKYFYSGSFLKSCFLSLYQILHFQHLLYNINSFKFFILHYSQIFDLYNLLHSFFHLSLLVLMLLLDLYKLVLCTVLKNSFLLFVFFLQRIDVFQVTSYNPQECYGYWGSVRDPLKIIFLCHPKSIRILYQHIQQSEKYNSDLRDKIFNYIKENVTIIENIDLNIYRFFFNSSLEV